MSATMERQTRQFDHGFDYERVVWRRHSWPEGAFDRDWVQQMREEVDVLFEEALQRPGGAVGRGPSATMWRFTRSD
jgi:hypothetical protein